MRFNANDVKSCVEYLRPQTTDGERRETLLLEHFEGYYNATLYYTRCATSADQITGNIDFETRCTCCGEVGLLGTRDVYAGQEAEAYQAVADRLNAHKPACDCGKRWPRA